MTPGAVQRDTTGRHGEPSALPCNSFRHQESPKLTFFHRLRFPTCDRRTKHPRMSEQSEQPRTRTTKNSWTRTMMHPRSSQRLKNLCRPLMSTSRQIRTVPGTASRHRRPRQASSNSNQKVKSLSRTKWPHATYTTSFLFLEDRHC